jgi:hypothetical protein
VRESKVMTGRCRLPRTIAAALLAATSAAGCATSATIDRRTGPTVVGRIDRSDAERLYVTTDVDRYTVERRDVVAIQHPGRVGRILGGITTGIGVGFLLLAPLAHDCDRSDPNDPRICWDLRTMAIGMGVLHLLVGLPIWLRNSAVLSRSQAAAALPGPLPSPPGW